MTTEQLKNYDYILLLDKSGSMGERDCPGNKTRWETAQEATIALARKCMEYDDNGITVIPFANTFKKYENVDGGDEIIKRIFQENEPNGGTNTAGVLKDVLDEYIASKGTASCKPVIVICITDGVPNDEKALVSVIVEASKKIQDENEIGLQFVQVGTDAHAHAFLKRLDDNMTSEGAQFDIVNTVTMDEMENMSLSDVLINALIA